MNHQQRDRGRRDAGNPRSLADRLGTMLRELLARFKRQTAYFRVVEAFRQARVFMRLVALDFVGLTLDIALVLDADLDLFLDLLEQNRIVGQRLSRRAGAVTERADAVIRNARTAQQLREAIFVVDRFAEQ